MRPTTSDVHIDRALTRVSIAYRNPNYIADMIFPAVPVQNQSDKYFTYDKASWFRDEAGVRAPGTRGPEVEYSTSTGTYACVEISATKVVPDEVVANADSPLAPRREAVEFATDKVQLRVERDVAGIVFGNGSWAASATPSTTWDNDASDPLADLETGRETIVEAIGREPNVMVMGRNVWTDLKHHPDLIDRIKYTNSTGILTLDKLKGLFEIPNIYVGTAIYNSAGEGATASYSFIWGKSAWIGWVPPSAGLMQPAAGYIFQWKNRRTETFRRDEEKADAIRVSAHYVAKVTATDAGYEFKSCVA
jgi:hypothetical protein